MTNINPNMDNFVDEFEKIYNEDDFILILLDACRFDVFKEIADDYLSGDLKCVWSAGYNTKEYVKMYKCGYDLTYISANPTISNWYAENKESHNFRPERHISDIINVWQFAWDKEAGTTRPENVTDVSIGYLHDKNKPRVVIHYMQPHAPYISDDIIGWAEDENINDISDTFSSDITRPAARVQNLIETGVLSDEKLKELYKANLEYALVEVCRLINVIDVDSKIIISSDHGENLGELKHYQHYNDTIYTRLVPWFEVEYASLSEDDNVEDKLRNLGYLE